MADSEINWVAEERSGHCAVLDGNYLYVWGGYVTYENNEVYLPNDEIWVYEIESGVWQRQPMKGELPRPMSGSCAACLNGVMYIFGGYDDLGYSNELYCVNLQVKDDMFTWKKLSNYQGNPPTPRDKLSCWVYKDRLIYFGGYGCKKISELNDSFDVNEASWEEEMFWGWNYDIHVFDPSMNVWYQPATKGMPPRPRAAHACATLGNKGYLFGGRILETRINDLHCLDLDTWTWSGEITVKGVRPQGRSWHTLTPVTDDQLFLFGGLSAESQPLSDAWIYSVGATEWRQLEHCPKNRPRIFSDLAIFQYLGSGQVQEDYEGQVPNLFCAMMGCDQERLGASPQGRWGNWKVLPTAALQQFTKVSLGYVARGESQLLAGIICGARKPAVYYSKLWHTACLGKEYEVMVFGGSKDDLLSYDSGHCNDVLIFQTQPYSLFRLCLDCIAKNSTVLQSQLPWLPRQLLSQVQKKITFWVSAGHQEK